MLDQKLVAAGAIALAVTLFSIFSMRPLARKLGLVDKPHGRKRHSGRVPLVGGLCFYLGTLVGLCYLGQVDHFVMSLVSGATLIMVTGLVDDFHNLSVRSRLLVEAGVVAWVIAMSGIYVDHIGPVLGDHVLRLGLFGIPFTIIAVIGLINAFNMLDGIDGLAASTAMVSILAMLAFGNFSGPPIGAVLLLQILFASLVPYVCVNLGWPDGRKIFMGDAGSTLLGFLLAWSLVFLSHAQVGRLQPADVLWCIALPVVETVAVMWRRIRLGGSPFHPDRQHFHFLLLDAGYTPRASLLAILAVAVALTATGFALRGAPQLVSALVFLVVMVAYVAWLPQGIELLKRRRTGLARGAWRIPSGKPGGSGLGFGGSSASSDAGALHAAGKVPVLSAGPGLAVEAAPSPVRALCVMASPADAARIAPIVHELSRDGRFDPKVCIAAVSIHRGQQLQDMVERVFGLHADFNVDVAEPGSGTPGVISIAVSGMERILSDATPDVVLLACGAEASLATTLAAYSRDVPVVCVASETTPEAGYRVDDADRRITRALAALHVASTESVKSELLAQGIGAQRVLVRRGEDDCQKVLQALAELRPLRFASEARPPRVGAVAGTAVESMQKAS